MIKVEELYNDFDNELYAFVVEDDRYTYVNVTNYWDFLEGNSMKEDEKIIEAHLIADNFSILNIPHIEEACDMVQRMWHDVMISENCMYYVDNDELEYLLSEKYHISAEEFHEKVNADIEKFHLEDVVLENSDESHYVCFGDFMGSFTGKRG